MTAPDLVPAAVGRFLMSATMSLITVNVYRAVTSESLRANAKTIWSADMLKLIGRTNSCQRQNFPLFLAKQ